FRIVVRLDDYGARRGERRGREIQQAENQVETDRRDPGRAAALEQLAGQKARRRDQLPHRAEDPAVHVEHLVREVVDEIVDRRVERSGLLSARRTKRPGQWCSAVVTGGLEI